MSVEPITSSTKMSIIFTHFCLLPFLEEDQVFLGDRIPFRSAFLYE